MSYRHVLGAGTLLASLAAAPLSAQQSTMPAPRDTSAASRSTVHDASADSALVELSRALAKLAASVQTAVAETAKNPEVRRQALATADKAVVVAHRTLVEHTDDIERLLQQASRQLEAMAAKEKARAAEQPKSAAPSGH